MLETADNDVVRVPRWLVPAAAASALVAGAAATPDHRTLLLAAAAAVPAAAAAAAVRPWVSRRVDVPSHARIGWLLVAAAASVAGVAAMAVPLFGAARLDPGFADLPRVLATGLGIAAALLLIGGRAGVRALDSMTEALLVAAPVTYLAIVHVLDARSDDVSAVQGIVSVLGVSALLVLVLLALELVEVQHRRSSAARFLLAGAVWMLLVEVSRTVLLLRGADEPPGTGVLGTVAMVVPALLWASATLHPHARRHVDPAQILATPLTRTRVVLVLATVTLGPLLIAMRTAAGRTDGLAGLTAGAAVVSAIAVAYLIRLVEQRARIEYLALHDDLCGIPNRVLLDDRVRSALAQAVRLERRVALLFLDLDRFKTINDSLGHAAGNEVLRAAADRLTDALRSSDTVARLGGDEFAVLLPDVDGVTAPMTVAEKVLHAFEAPFEVAGRHLFVSPSIGVSMYPDDAADAEDLLRNADVAMYRAKQKGGAGFQLYTHEMNAWAHQRLTIESHLHHAMRRGELVMHYQPKIELRTGRIVGMEALMRWQHPELGLVPPSQFIPLAEENGLIVPLGEWALEEACTQAKAWADAELPPLTVSVNVSARQFEQQAVASLVARTLRSTGLHPASLELELTESLALQDPDLTTATLQDLRDMGVHCSIDDFGTGYSGLRYLTRFPINRLKIDKYFISEISSGSGNARIVAAVIALAHGLRLEVVAEGVENHDQRLFLQEHGCDEMQGFLFSQAVPAAEFERLLRSDQPHFDVTRGVPPVTGPLLKVWGSDGATAEARPLR